MHNGATDLFVALDMINGMVIGECMGCYRHEEFVKFLRKADWENAR
jgi:hypothetical protein